ncbi:MAG: TonB-dependent receptor plug domain-containing protein, partial [Bacteroidales bacterium]|nr:TonB-dependent receptor plug domain-containing protein [Bacteroidales bacterium]
MLQLSALLMFALVSFPVFAAPKPVQMENLQQQAHAVRGVVSDAMGPMAGVDVIVNGTNNSVATNLNGAYVLQNVPVGATLKFSFIGYKTQEIPVTSEEVINVLLEEEVKYLEELVLIGYGTVRKSDLTGSVTSVGEEQMTKSATSDALQAIQGRAAGVQIITATGSPSATAEIKIRGTGSPNGTTPLYVVDGFPMNDIDYLSPGDISSIEILKDASACAIYGSRGANGVVLVTTKKGSAGALKSKVTAEYGIEALPTRPQMLNSSEYALLTNKAYTNSG